MSSPSPAARTRFHPGWLVAIGLLAVALLVSLVFLVQAVRPPSYEPVPVPSVSST